MDILGFLLFSPLFLLYFGFLGGFGAAIAEGGREDHAIWLNAVVGALASGLMGALFPQWTLEESFFAGPLPTLVGAALIWWAALKSSAHQVPSVERQV